MIKIVRRDTEKSRRAMIELERFLRRGTGECSTQAIMDALEECFYGKCYLCENKMITSYEVEHLRPHRGRAELKYDWNNLFLSCRHCNNIKGENFTNILDCTKYAVDELIAFRETSDMEIIVEALSNDASVIETVDLLRKCYDGNTPQKKMEAKTIKRHLHKELLEFKDLLMLKESNNEQEVNDAILAIERETGESSAFTSFKRWILKDEALYNI